MTSRHALGAGRQWQVTAFRAPPKGESGQAAVRAVRELRARVLFDRGRRPAFAGPGGRFVDDQDLDMGAWHFLARAEPDGPPLGYVRLCTPAATGLFQSRAFLGGTRFEELLREQGVTAEEVFEHSRLVVEHRARKLGLGLYLNAWAIAAAHHLGATAMIGTSGTKDGQDRFHERFGFQAVAGTRRYVQHYTEDVVIMFHRVAGGAGHYTDLVEQLRDQFPAAAAAAAASAPPPIAGRPASGQPAPASLAGLTGAGGGDRQGWQPVLFDPADAGGVDGLAGLLAGGQVNEVHDTLKEQLTELVTSRDPSCTDPREISRRRREQLAGAEAWEYGTWVWYPWSRRLGHVLAREEFRLVRTDRNRGRIDRPQQRRLLHRRIGVIGLSVGSSSAVTLALEGIGGAFKLADFDDLGLSNLNRLRAGVHDLGTNKAVICARQMYEIDPYLDIEIHADGLTQDNIEDFFTGGNGPIDLLVEECDTPWAKIAAREHARDLGIPVVMDCNDRGMLDIERFDLEPDRPLLHGRLGDVKSVGMLELTRSQKVDLILAMVDAGRISPELAASFGRLGTTLSSWPQLASGVALGGALTSEAARRILLNQPCPSGRFYTDLHQQLHPDNDTVGSSTAGSMA
jgi:predicted N-acetyltransferase YhbS